MAEFCSDHLELLIQLDVFGWGMTLLFGVLSLRDWWKHRKEQ